MITVTLFNHASVCESVYTEEARQHFVLSVMLHSDGAVEKHAAGRLYGSQRKSLLSLLGCLYDWGKLTGK